MPADIEPPELARLVDFAERPRTHDWSMRAALVRYASPQPQRVDDLLNLVRRLDGALGRQNAVLARDGDQIWAVLNGGASADAANDDADVIELLRAAVELDRIGDVLAAWAIDISGDRPDAQVDAVIADVGPRLERLGVPQEERPPPTARSRG
jgi:hypothetical protein